MIKKISSRKGATMLMAIFYLLVCLIAGAIVLSAAYANTGRMQRNAADQQNYLAVSSALRLAADDVAGKTFTGSWQKTSISVYHPPVLDENGETISPSRTEKEDPIYKAGDCFLSDESLFLPADLLKNIYLKQLAPEVLHPVGSNLSDLQLPLNFAAQSEDEVLPPISGTLHIVASKEDPQGRSLFTIYITVSAHQEDEEVYETTLTLPGSCTTSSNSQTETVENTTTTTVTSTTTVSWGEPQIIKGGTEE